MKLPVFFKKCAEDIPLRYRQKQIIKNAHLPEQSYALERTGNTEREHFMRRNFFSFFSASDNHCASINRIKTCKYVRKSGLAGAVRAHHTGNRAFLKRNGKAIHGAHAAEFLCEIFCLKRIHKEFYLFNFHKLT